MMDGGKINLTNRAAYIAADFGGGSGRVMAGVIDEGRRLHLIEIYRFANRQVRLGRHIYWDFLSLYADLLEGLRRAVTAGLRIRSIGVNTWGVDFGLIDAQGNLIGNPVCYRDESVEGLPEEFFESHSAAAHYAVNGTQVMAINTLFRLRAIQRESPDMLASAAHLLFMPDLFRYFLTGNIANEYTIASTSELLDARRRDWDCRLIAEMGFPVSIFGRIIMPGTSCGCLLPHVAAAIGVDYPVEVVAVGSHDTASAVYATVNDRDDTPAAWLSSGTWSLLGIDLAQPVLTEAARQAGFTNEGGVGGRIRFLQNITGLWMLQRLMAAWASQGAEVDIAALVDEACDSGISTVVDVDDDAFASAADMPTVIADYCRKHDLQVPVTRGEFARVVIQSLAQRYARGIAQLNSLLPRPVRKLRVMGGGSRNQLLNRLTAEAAGIEVVAAEAEATAIGNILVQAEAAGAIGSRSDISSIAQDKLYE